MHSIPSSVIARLELTKRICLQAKLPEQALQAVFCGAMNQLEIESNVEFKNSMKERIWEVISDKRLHELRQTLFSEVYFQIQENMNESQVTDLLNSQKNTVYIANITKTLSVKDAVMTKAKLMVDELIHDLITELKKEGIGIHFSP